MRRLPPPVHDADTSLQLCAKSINDGGLRLRLLSSLNLIRDAETEYKDKGPLSQLFTVAETSTLGAWVDGSEMTRLYKGAFSRKGSSARFIYDEIKLGAIGNICPLCNQRTVSTLDHYLAKAHHPALAITPINLVPSCRDCNLDTLARRPTTISEQTLHPYFDSVDDEIWLVASVIQSNPPVVSFSANPPTSWSQSKQDIVRTHFQAFRLATLYTTHAATELVNIYHDISTVALAQGASAIQDHLSQQASNRRHVVRNSWQAAMYDALAQSDWFCTGGYLSVV